MSDTRNLVSSDLLRRFMPDWSLESRYARLPREFHTMMTAEQVGQPRLVHANDAAARLIGLDQAAFADPDFAAVFSGHRPVDGFSPLAMAYAGHQFGVYVPQLGDGRALLIAQLRGPGGELWDVQLKGSGRTPYSRFGDGRAVLRSSIREYLCSEAMAALAIPTTRALCIVATGERVRRESLEPGAVLTRLAPSFVRFGHFEYFHNGGRPDLVRLLADDVIAEHFPGLAGRAQIYRDWFVEVVARTARLIAGWQAAGFAHGVMNTDNMSILGLTLDYGPFGFLDAYAPGFVCNHTDEGGRYAFDRQPAVALWNLGALAYALTSLIPEDMLREALGGFADAFAAHHAALMRAKLGLARAEPDDEALTAELLDIMREGGADYTLAFRQLARAGANREAWLGLFSDAARIRAQAWLDTYLARIAGEDDVASRMDRANPKYVLRNWVAEAAIRAAEDRDDWSLVGKILCLVQSPFEEHPEDEEFARPPPPEMRDLAVSCSS